MEIFRRHSAIISNSFYMSVASGLSAALGFLYWIVAAKNFSASAVGLSGALIAIMNTVGLLGDLGLATILAGRASVLGSELRSIFSGAAVFACAVTLLLGLCSAAALHVFDTPSADLLASPSHIAMFIIGVEMCALTVLIDNLSVGLLKSWIQLVRSLCFSVLKLVFLVLLAATGFEGEIGIFFAWIAGGLMSFIVSLSLLPELKGVFSTAPNISILRNLRGEMMGHHLINCASQGPALIIPALATLLISADAGGPFYVAWQVFTILLLVPASLSTAIYAVNSSATDALVPRLIFSLAVSLIFSLFAFAIVYSFAADFLEIFNPIYAVIASPCLVILSTSVAAAAIKCHFIAICRIRGTLLQGGLVLTIAGFLEIAAAAVGAWKGGISGLAVGFSLASFVEIAMYLPALIRPFRGARAG